MGWSGDVCCVSDCKNTKDNAVKAGKFLTFTGFPNYPWYKERKELWIRFCKRVNKDGSTWQPTRIHRICSDHFVGGARSEDPRHPGFNPTIRKLTEKEKRKSKILIERYKRRMARIVHPVPKITKKRKKVTDLNKNREDMEITEDDVHQLLEEEPEETVDSSKEIMEGPKPLLCLVCCSPCPSSSYQIYARNANFMRFCRLLYPSVESGNQFLQCLKNVSSLTLCFTCLSALAKAGNENSAVIKISDQVLELQKQLLDSLKHLQQAVGNLKGAMKIIQDKVISSDKKVLEKHLNQEKNTRKIYRFREKVLKQVSSLGGFQDKLQEKVQCDRRSIQSPPPPTMSSTEELPACPPSPEETEDTGPPSPVTEEPPPPTSSVLSEGRPLYRKIPPPKTPIALGKSIRYIPNPNGGPKLKVEIQHVWDGKTWEQVMSPLAPPPSSRSTEPPLSPSRPRSTEPPLSPPPGPPVSHHFNFQPPSIAPPVPKPCPKCQKLIRPTYLKVHMKYACLNSKKPVPLESQHLCHLCTKAFPQKRGLYIHLKSVHITEHAYLCTQCPYAGKTMGALRVHEKGHTDKRLHLCRKGCGGAFKTASTRLKHDKLCNGKGTPFRKKCKRVEPPEVVEQND